MKVFEDSQIDRMKHYLDFASRRQQVINSNIANLETPGYRARELEFESMFRTEMESDLALKTTRTAHQPDRPVLIRDEPRVRPTTSGGLGNDLNNVDLDKEMTGLAENVLKFSALAQMIKNKLQLIRSSIQGG